MSLLTAKALAGFVIRLILVSALLFVPAWPLNFWEAKVFLVIFFLPQLLIIIYLLRKDPDLLKRRIKGGLFAEKRTNQKVIMLLLSLCSVLMLVVSAFDHAFKWSQVPGFLVLTADGVILIGFWIQFVAFNENTFASAVVVIAAHQKAISTGPYAVVRHPMYAGALLVNIATPVALGSWWRLAFAGAMLAVIILRLLDEENFLGQNLPNYEEYCRNVHWRLIPHIW
jgi:protein-S-isoprenylcysteine O-methyltransferase Ste14